MIKEEYKQWIVELKRKIRSAQAKAALAVNRELIILYWDLGKTIAQKENVWGSKLLENISSDLKSEFPGTGGFSITNLRYCKMFYKYFSTGQQVVAQLDGDKFSSYPQVADGVESSDLKKDEIHQQAVDEFLPQAVAKIPWGHITLLISKVKDPKAAFFYIQQTVEKGWSRDWLLNAIKMDSYALSQKQIKSNNFSQTLPVIHSDYANEVFKDSYNLSFLGISEKVKEAELEKRLVEKLKSFLLELGKGFTFIGNQYRLEYNNKEYFIDMLFFHRGLQSLVAIELKIGTFKAEYAGKMNLYLSLLDRLEKGKNENPSIGIILCADKDHLDVEIALQDINKPIGVAEYQFLLPKDELQALLVSEIKASEQENCKE